MSGVLALKSSNVLGLSFDFVDEMETAGRRGPVRLKNRPLF